MIQIKLDVIRKVLLAVEYKCTILFFIINSKETSRKIFSNNYVPCYQDLNALPWFERDDFLNNINGLKCEQFMENPDEHFNNAEVETLILFTTDVKTIHLKILFKIIR